jgi:hypothetical protein
MINFSFLRAARFWIATSIAFVIIGLLFAWELNILQIIGLSGPLRYETSTRDLLASSTITVLFSFSIGLIAWRQRYGSCPTSAKGATGAAGFLGALALICPACIALPVGIASFSVSLAFLSPFVPLFQLIAIIILCTSCYISLPKKL